MKVLFNNPAVGSQIGVSSYVAGTFTAGVSCERSQQHLNSVAIFLDSPVKRCLIIIGSCIDVGAMGDEEFHHLGRILPNRAVERCATIIVGAVTLSRVTCCCWSSNVAGCRKSPMHDTDFHLWSFSTLSGCISGFPSVAETSKICSLNVALMFPMKRCGVGH